MEKAGLKSAPSAAYRPLQIRSPVQFHKWAGLGNNTTPHKGGTREKHNSHKQRSRETKRRPMTAKLMSRSDDQTLKLHRLQTQALSKAKRKMRAEYNAPHQRKAVIYKEARTPGEFTRSAPVLHKPVLKLRAFLREGILKSLVAQFQRNHFYLSSKKAE